MALLLFTKPSFAANHLMETWHLCFASYFFNVFDVFSVTGSLKGKHESPLSHQWTT